MSTSVVMPQMGLEVTEGIVVEILVAVGDAVEQGQPLVEVETDKALTEVPAPRAGVVREVCVETGDTVPVGGLLLRMAATMDEVLESAPEPASPPSMDRAPAAEPHPPAPEAGSYAERRIRAAPVARRAAKNLGVDVNTLEGTGPRGRVTLRDVERAADESHDAPPAAAPDTTGGAGRTQPLSAFQRTAVRTLNASQLIPQFVLFRAIDARWLLAEKARLVREQPVKISVNDLILQAFAETLERHVLLAAAIEGDEGGQQLRWPSGVHLGMAVAAPRGLLVPVIRNVHEISLSELALERHRLVEASRAGGLRMDEMSGGVSTLSSLASFGVDAFQAMLHPGQSSILSVGRTVDGVVPEDRGLAIFPRLTFGLTVDHRVVDGAAAGAALAELCGLLEGAMLWRD